MSRWPVVPSFPVRAGLVVALVLVLAVLPAFAHASPPDSSWSPGLYDNDDYDDVVILVTSATADIAPDAPDLRPIQRSVAGPSADPAGAEHGHPVSDVLGRAPPVAA